MSAISTLRRHLQRRVDLIRELAALDAEWHAIDAAMQRDADAGSLSANSQSRRALDRWMQRLESWERRERRLKLTMQGTAEMLALGQMEAGR